MEQLLTVREVARALTVCRATVYKWVAEGVLPHVRIVNAVRIAPNDFHRFIVARRGKECS